MYLTKRASADELGTAVTIMDRILEEDPSYWPYGLSLDHFKNGGDLYLVQKSASREPVGFVGWQQQQDGERKVGYYAIGVLPEHRHQGFAKAAVSSLLREKAAGVDEVRALVCEHNAPSQALAKALPDVKLMLHKAAATPSMKAQVIGSILGALGTAALADQAVDPEHRTFGSTLQPWKWDKERQLLGATNMALGGLGGHQLINREIGKGLTAITLAPTKDLALKSLGTLSKLDRLAEAAKTKIEQPASTSPGLLGSIPKPLLLGALGLGAGGLGVAALLAKKKLDAEEAAASAARAGRVRVTLPTKQPGDAETTLDLPVEDIRLSNALRTRLGRDTRRRLYSETRARTQRRKPRDPNNPTEKELEDAQLEQEESELDKEASIVGFLGEFKPHWFISKSATSQPTVPVPPNSPAAKMQQQQAQANSIDTSTAANPQIMKAQQDAQQASMQAQQQVAQAEQGFQQQLGEQASKFRDQLAQADQSRQQVQQENQILKLQLEKAKAEADLAATKHKVTAEIGKAKADAEGSASGLSDERVSKMIQNRLARLRSRMGKSAALDPKTGKPAPEDQTPIDPKTGRHELPPVEPVKPESLQDVNTRGLEYMAEGRMPQIGVYRTSYGPIGDMLYSNILRPGMLMPSQRAMRIGAMSPAAMSLAPDKLGVISQVSDELTNRAQEFMNQPRY